MHLSITVKNLFTLTRGQWKKKWRTGMLHILKGLCHYASNCFIWFHKGRIYSTGSKQLQVKGQCIYYQARKGNAYIIQSASASHLEWIHYAALKPFILDNFTSSWDASWFEQTFKVSCCYLMLNQGLCDTASNWFNSILI